MSAVPAGFVDRCRERIDGFEPWAHSGEVRSCVGTVIEGVGLRAPVGTLCRIGERSAGRECLAQVVGFREDSVLLMLLDEGARVQPGARYSIEQSDDSTPAGDACLGRVLDSFGRPIDGGPTLAGAVRVPLVSPPSSPMSRERIAAPLDLGVRSINALATAGRGMRLGVFAGSGVGKSTLLGQMARFTEADVSVIALVGERGREVREFLERDLGEGLQRSVVVVATGDQAPLLRVRAALAATAIAERFRRQGRHVLLLMDSLTRYCAALREIGLAAGEPPTSRGYPPSVWSALPKLLERAGTSSSGGSITGLYTVLVEGDDPDEPVSDAARSILDGHIHLSRELAERGQFPPIDPLSSVSRVMDSVVSNAHQGLATKARALLATHRRAEDLIAIGAYVPGSDPEIDEARRRIDNLRALLAQGREEHFGLEDSVAALARAVGPDTGKPVAEAAI